MKYKVCTAHAPTPRAVFASSFLHTVGGAPVAQTAAYGHCLRNAFWTRILSPQSLGEVAEDPVHVLLVPPLEERVQPLHRHRPAPPLPLGPLGGQRPDLCTIALDVVTGWTLDTIEAGADGELVYTTVEREAHLMIRFRSHDHVEVLHFSETPSGRTAPRITTLGRTDDMLLGRGLSSRRRCRSRSRWRGCGTRACPAERIAERIRSKLSFKAEIRFIADGTLPRTSLKTQHIRRAYEDANGLTAPARCRASYIDPVVVPFMTSCCERTVSSCSASHSSSCWSANREV